MINYTELSTIDYDKFYNKIAEMEVTVYEDLYDYAGDITPYECTADCIISPKYKYHNEYFNDYKKAAIELYNKVDYRLIAYGITKDDLRALDKIGDRINYAKDSIELTWAGMELHKNVSPYIKNGKFILC